jgi:hypothetical protein
MMNSMFVPRKGDLMRYTMRPVPVKSIMTRRLVSNDVGFQMKIAILETIHP